MDQINGIINPQTTSNNMSTKAIIIIVVLVLIVLAIVGWKKGWFKKKDSSATTSGGRKLSPEESAAKYKICTEELNSKSDAELVNFISSNGKLDRNTLSNISRPKLIHIATSVCAVDFPTT